MDSQLVHGILMILFIHGLLLAFALVLYGLYLLGQMIVSQVLHVCATISLWSSTAKRVREIRTIGQQTRHTMQQLYSDYMAQLKAQKGR